jgi:hypothetical protein
VDAAARAEALGNRVAALAAARRRDDLVESLEAELGRTSDPATVVVVAGETKRGKSSLINALLSSPGLSPVDTKVATSAHIVFRHAEQPLARIVYDAGETEDVPLEELDAWATEAGNPANEKGVRAIEVLLPHPLLARGVTLVDTPGVGGLDAAHAQVTKAALATSDALLFVVDASAPLSGPELRFLQEATDRIDTVWFALTKRDAFQGWSQILADDRELLAGTRYAGAPFYPVSSTIKLRADELAAAGKEDLAAVIGAESGFDALEQGVAEQAVGKARTFRLANLLRLGEASISRLQELERAAIDGAHPDGRLQAELEQAKAQAQEFRPVRSKGGRLLERQFRHLQNDVDLDFNRALAELRRRSAERIAKHRFDDLPRDLERELQALDTTVSTSISERAATLVGDLERELELAGVGQLTIANAAVLDPASAISTRPALRGSALIDATASMSSVYLGQRVGWLLGFLIPGGAVIGAAAGAVFAGVMWKHRKGIRDQSQAQAVLNEAVEWARREIPPVIRERLWDAKDAVEAELGSAIERREQELTEAINERKRVAGEDAVLRAREREAAEARLKQLEELSGEVSALRASGAARPTTAPAPPVPA